MSPSPPTDPDSKLAQAERYVREGKKHVEHQRTVIARFEMGGHRGSARMAQKVLSTLEKSLRLAEEDLRQEREKAGNAPRE
jgi:hypothetical protein